MRVVIQHNKFFEWVPVPAGTQLTEEDVRASKIRPAARQIPDQPRLWPGNWDMKVTLTQDTHTDVHIDEASIFHALFHRDVRAMRLTRRQGVALLLSKHVVPERFPESAMVSDVLVHDDGPHEDTFRSLLAPHLASGLLNQAQHDAHVEKYMEHHDDHSAAHMDHLRSHFGARPKAGA